ncbi:MAG: hypothetical protein HPM95_03145 [Alphaproteobacteria bacterium]|nr:hypothetical protein [Alphaproteobacteria bacterium]
MWDLSAIDKAVSGAVRILSGKVMAALAVFLTASTVVSVVDTCGLSSSD